MFEANGAAIRAQCEERGNLSGAAFDVYATKAWKGVQQLATIAPTVTDDDIRAYSEASVDRNVHTICTNALRGNMYPRAQVVRLILDQRAKDAADVDAIEDAKG